MRSSLPSSTVLVTVVMAAVALRFHVVRGQWMEVRLVGGNSANDGRLEIKITDPTKTQQVGVRVGQWGTVCDDHWDLADSMVACRMLGFTAGGLLLQPRTASPLYAATAEPHIPILMDDVQCSGGETSLEQCVYDEAHDCEHHEDVHLRCFGSNVYNTSDATWQPSNNNDLALILVGIATQLTRLANQSTAVLELLGPKQQNISGSGVIASGNEDFVHVVQLRKQLSDELEALKSQQSFLWTVLCLLVLCFLVGFVSMSIFIICLQQRSKSSRRWFGKSSISPYDVPILTRQDSLSMVSRDGIMDVAASVRP